MPENRASPYLILGALWLLVFSVSSQTMIIAPILPRIAEQLNIAASRLGLLVTGYAVAVGVVALIMGPVSDKLGRRQMLLIGAGIMTIALALHGMAYNYVFLVGVRILTGIGGGALTGAAAAYVGDYFPRERHGWANGWLMSGVAVGQILGIPMGAVLAGQFGFRVPFLAFAVTMGLAFVLVWWFVPQPDVSRYEGRLDMRALLRYYSTMIAQPEVSAAALTSFGIFLSTSLFLLYLPVWLESSWGATSGQIAFLFAIGGIATVIAGPQAGKLSDRVGRKPLVIASSLVLAVVMLSTTYLVAGLWTSYALFFLLMALSAARASPFQALLAEIVPDQQRGSLMSLSMALGQAGSGLGGAIAGPAYGAYGYTSNTLIGAAAVLLTVVLVGRFIAEPGRGRPLPAPDGGPMLRFRSPAPPRS